MTLDISLLIASQSKWRMRKCLGLECGKEFMSSGPWQRICPGCIKHSNTQRQDTIVRVHRERRLNLPT